MKHKVSILLERQDDSLVRLTGLLYRKGYVIESLSSGPTEEQGRIRVTAVISGIQKTPRLLMSQVAKLFDVISVDVWEDNSSVQTN
ncbi:acetolactate synthase, small subunit [Thermosinus carboxydivorans Nor1]|uniref:Acetolactate synthase, small subunit n=1 Tax=Thermosinus carboxydivorans Nor1 TaxID=401526 RepID=A1HU21_9FIRM|nr:ACT domain-containing protein [Thermosinus carboxydivorans]EAX46494.1 acetolactate synthase, small subunit [Thermosinus carboxydivorans Nor1]